MGAKAKATVQMVAAVIWANVLKSGKAVAPATVAKTLGVKVETVVRVLRDNGSTLWDMGVGALPSTRGWTGGVTLTWTGLRLAVIDARQELAEAKADAAVLLARRDEEIRKLKEEAKRRRGVEPVSLRDRASALALELLGEARFQTLVDRVMERKSFIEDEVGAALENYLGEADQLVTFEVIVCKGCGRRGLSVNNTLEGFGHRLTDHKCAGAWETERRFTVDLEETVKEARAQAFPKDGFKEAI